MLLNCLAFGPRYLVKPAWNVYAQLLHTPVFIASLSDKKLLKGGPLFLFTYCILIPKASKAKQHPENVFPSYQPFIQHMATLTLSRTSFPCPPCP